MNKNTKIWWNYIAGGVISVTLLWSIYTQVSKQLNGIDREAWMETGNIWWLTLCIALMLVNTSLESLKWHLLVNSVEPVSYGRTAASYLAGVAFSIITPNRIGEYPGRILYLGKNNAFRYLTVSALGIMAQLSGLYLFGMIGLIYYNIHFPSLLAQTGLAACIIVNILLGIVYWKFDSILPAIAKVRWLCRYITYGKLLNRFPVKRQLQVLGISLLRFIIFTAQYLFLLRWMNVTIPLGDGFCLAALFFWVMAVIPGIAVAEPGVRGNVSLFLFHHFSSNTIGILAATTGIWLLNLILPSIFGSILIIRMKLLR